MLKNLYKPLMVLESASIETPLEGGECDKIGGKALDNGERNEQVVKAKWRRRSLIPREKGEREEGRKVMRLERGAMR